MKRLKGPELKMPELKVPDFVYDLYYDLRERRLLPLVALVIVAIVAVPFLLGGESETESPLSGEAGTSTSDVESAKLAVVEAKPGLRDYRKRLRDRRPTDPFEQRYTSPVLKGTELGSDAEGFSDGESTTSVTKTSTKVTKTTETNEGDTTKTVTTTTDETTEGAGSEPGSAGGPVLFSFAVDVKIVRTVTKPDGSKDKTENVRHRVLPPAALPSEKTQVVTYLGISPTTQKPLLLISDEVTAVYGEGECLSGSESCQLLEIETGFPVTFVHGLNGTRYKINVLDIEAVSVDQP